MTTRILFAISILTLNYISSFSQTKEKKIDRLTISYAGDSMLAQRYELIIKSKRIYLITPVMNYLHIKGGKYKKRVRLKQDKREKIFDLVDRLTWTNLTQREASINGGRFYTIETLDSDKLIITYQISEELLPSDFRTLYETISDRK
jgi:hypothetical protein